MKLVSLEHLQIDVHLQAEEFFCPFHTTLEPTGAELSFAQSKWMCNDLCNDVYDMYDSV